MKRVHIVMLLAGIFLLLAYPSHAQLPNNSGSSNNSEQAEATKYEQYYEIVLQRSLREYYEKDSYIVDVKAAVERVATPEGYDVVEPPPSIEIENLPGLPVVPPHLMNNEPGQDSLRISGFRSGFQLSQLNIRVLVDTSFTQEDLEFIEEAAIMVTNADLMRGDVVDVVQRAFPKKPGSQPKKKAEPEEPEPEPVEEVAETNEFLGIDWNDPRQLLYVILGLAAILLLLLIYFAFRKPRSKEEELSDYMVQQQPFQQQPQQQLKESPAEDEVRELKSDKQTEYERDKMFITNACVSNPALVADIIEEWIEEDDEEGVVKAVRSIHSVDPKLINVLEGHLDEETATSIKFGLSNIEVVPIKEKAEEVENFKKSIKSVKQKSGEKDSNNNLFDFLEQLSNQQLMHLVKGESDEMTAILLAQVAGDRSSYVLQKMPEEKRLSVVLKMGKINNIPISIYKKVAAHFSSKALTVSDMKFVAADGIESILNTIDSLPVDEQEDFVNSIAKKDLELAKKIRKYFVAFDDIPTLSDEVLQASLENVQTEKIIPALYEANQDVQKKILSVRPKREQQLILSELGNIQDMSAADIEQARKALLQEIRQYLKTKG